MNVSIYEAETSRDKILPIDNNQEVARVSPDESESGVQGGRSGRTSHSYNHNQNQPQPDTNNYNQPQPQPVKAVRANHNQNQPQPNTSINN